MASFPVSFQKLTTENSVGWGLLLQAPELLSFNAAMLFKSITRRIRTNFIIGTTLVDNEVGRMIYEDFLPRALAEGRYVAAPPAQIVGRGLQYVQTGFDVQREGVSACKVVVSL